MSVDYTILKHILLGIQLLTALVGFYYFFKLKNSYWKWFCVYLIIILIQEIYSRISDTFFGLSPRDYFAFIGIPIQSLFFIWLYALKSQNNKKLFFLCSFIYLLTLPLVLYFEELDRTYSLNLNIQALIFSLLLVLEFRKQIKNEDILKFKENRMFYINVGMVLFYIGNYPFMVFNKILYEEYLGVWNMLFLYFLISNCIMYLLFIASLIWGKTKS